ncbi:FAD-binding oxidoreductase [Acuticoccus sp. M5D2P5]|uniref:NAD(P)/FAD-dependent oxidoreductase n=1 Tax=Acuticoccus kalidii TaxID=2910977 RepID=UPI001F43F827|nr:FAD-binding oxidoreductase [Acuticoccus kalidii]MCF3936763.1 FAD-binding oxidoreductase [Acuticoccus kalidii]
MTDVDVIVLGAGMVGIATALHLLDRGKTVALIDRREPAEETSFGNAGLIQSEAVIPYAFPHDPAAILAVLTGQSTAASLQWKALPAIAPWLMAYARQSSKSAIAKTAAANVPLVRRAFPEHHALMERADALKFLHEGGYLRLYRTDAELERSLKLDEVVRERYGVAFEVWDKARLRAEEPFLSDTIAGAIHMPEPKSVDDPSDVGKAYAALFQREGGRFIKGDATTLRREGAGWQVTGEDGPVRAKDVVVALGPWSGDLLKANGVDVPLGVKRGYHMHYAAEGDAVLNHPFVDEANGFVVGPNKRGYRLTTGAEFSNRDAPPSPVQLDHAEPKARALFPLGKRLQDKPWLGSRPSLPDLLPMIGPVPGVPGMWANFGHHHLGFTLGPATGRLLAEMITGEAPFTDPAPYAVDRVIG